MDELGFSKGLVRYSDVSQQASNFLETLSWVGVNL